MPRVDQDSEGVTTSGTGVVKRVTFCLYGRWTKESTVMWTSRPFLRWAPRYPARLQPGDGVVCGWLRRST
jgi:hypothetical protein